MELEKEIFNDGMPKGYYTHNDNGKYVLETNHSAAFLQEAAELFGSDELADLSKEMNAIGDNWRAFSVTAARIIKQKSKEEETFAKAGGLMLICAGREENFFENLNKVVRKLKA